MRAGGANAGVAPAPHPLSRPGAQNERLSGRCVYFVRVNPKGVSEKSLDTDVAAGDIVGPGALDAFRALVSDVYLPVLQVRAPRTGRQRAGGARRGGRDAACWRPPAPHARAQCPCPCEPGPTHAPLLSTLPWDPQEQSAWGKMPQEHAKEFLDGAGESARVEGCHRARWGRPSSRRGAALSPAHGSACPLHPCRPLQHGAERGGQLHGRRRRAAPPRRAPRRV
jgi:hypothetical protein